MKRLFKGEAYRPTGYGINVRVVPSVLCVSIVYKKILDKKVQKNSLHQ
ncbi:MAG: hypothetical protein LBJ00_14445 [Planctomycetaceae bacterium]|nr:hypothetical protein [Planctomycetaceae bacterium]